MMRNKVISLMSVIIFCLVACVTAPIMADDKTLCERIKAVEGQAAFLVAYSKDTGKPIAIFELPGFEVVGEGGPTKEEQEKGEQAAITLEKLIPLLNDLVGKKEKVLDPIGSPTLFVHGSPGCYIKTSTGGWKCICPN